LPRHLCGRCTEAAERIDSKGGSHGEEHGSAELFLWRDERRHLPEGLHNGRPGDTGQGEGGPWDGDRWDQAERGIERAEGRRRKSACLDRLDSSGG
jgi:hypothetical protein